MRRQIDDVACEDRMDYELQLMDEEAMNR